MIVVDASTWVDYLIGALDARHRTTLLSGDATSPPHVDFEVGSALLRLERREKLRVGIARALMAEFATMPFPRERNRSDASTAFELINNAAFADALYLVMAQRLDCAVMTSDSGMVGAAGVASIEVINTAVV